VNASQHGGSVLGTMASEVRAALVTRWCSAGRQAPGGFREATGKLRAVSARQAAVGLPSGREKDGGEPPNRERFSFTAARQGALFADMSGAIGQDGSRVKIQSDSPTQR
jgi:hypothetical protein